MKPKISVLGTGRMGSALVKAFRKQGYHVDIWNRTRSRCEPLAVALDVSVEEAELKAQRATEKHDSFDPANNVVPESTIARTVKASTISPT